MLRPRAADAGASIVVADLREDRTGRLVKAEALDGMHGLVQCAGSGRPWLVVDRDGEPLPIESFRRVVEANLVGTLNAIRPAAPAMPRNESTADGAARDHRQHRVDRGPRRPDRTGLVLCLEERCRRHDPADRSRARRSRHPGDDDRAAAADTPMLAELRDDVRASLDAQVPFPPRLGWPEEHAVLVRHIVENVFPNGGVIRLDGAPRMGPR